MSHTIEDRTLDEAMHEALRFLKAAKALRAARKAARQQALDMGWHYGPMCMVDNAKTCRASMDLSRKLAQLRAGR